jgi:hypothetical protein
MLSIIRRTVQVVHSVNIHSIIRRSIGTLEIAGLDEIIDLCIEKIGLDEFTFPSSIGNLGTMELDVITDLSSFARYFFKLVMRHLVEAEAEKGEQLKNFVFIIDGMLELFRDQKRRFVSTASLFTNTGIRYSRERE